MAKMEFLKNLRTARNLFVHRAHADHPGIDTRQSERQLASAAIWLTPSAVKGFDAKDFPEISKERRADIEKEVKRFKRVAERVPPTRPATSGQFKEAAESFRALLEMLEPYFPDRAEQLKIDEVLRNIQIPLYVVSLDYEFGADSTGEPAVWIWVYVSDEAARRTDFLEESLEIERRILDAVRGAGISRWPYVRYRAASEEWAR